MVRAKVDLPDPGLAHDAQSLAGIELKAHVLHRVNIPLGLDELALFYREKFCQVLHF